MVGEELLLPVGISLIAGVGRGLRGFAKHRKEDKAKLDLKKFFVSLGASTVFGAGIAILIEFLGIDPAGAEALIVQVAAPWGLTDVAEDVIKEK